MRGHDDARRVGAAQPGHAGLAHAVGVPRADAPLLFWRDEAPARGDHQVPRVRYRFALAARAGGDRVPRLHRWLHHPRRRPAAAPLGAACTEPTPCGGHCARARAALVVRLRVPLPARVSLQARRHEGVRAARAVAAAWPPTRRFRILDKPVGGLDAARQGAARDAPVRGALRPARVPQRAGGARRVRRAGHDGKVLGGCLPHLPPDRPS
mmetsp:Transcript_3122/g.7677  ORF Transcript_3122/g.7677 Transcript_3122/m.7677 type:complete len:210 (+) Transcript_3122:186-815(+)